MIEDLSLRHELVSDLFELPKSPADWRKHRLAPSQVDFYQQNGYLAGVRLLSDEQVEVLREELMTLADPSYPGNPLFYEYHSNEAVDKTTVLFHALGAWRITPAMHDVLWNPAFTVAASQLLDGAVRFWHDQLFCKPPRHGGVVAWHQDYSYWTRTKPMAHLTCWIALDDVSCTNGCLHYIPGSHRWPLLPITGLAGDMTAIQTVLNEEQKAQFQPVPVEFPKGHATFHHPLTIHGSYANRSDRPRRGLVINVFHDGVVSDSDEPLLEGVPPIPKGQKMGGQFFPLLLDPPAHPAHYVL
jgi:ectoine hydroxylase-related dioxygenase (phytanoyl-CoA dioxygenase family)